MKDRKISTNTRSKEIRPKNILLFKSHFYKSSEIPILHDKNCIKW